MRVTKFFLRPHGMLDSNPQTIYLKDYAPPAFLVDHVLLDMDLRASFTEVTATLRLTRNPHATPEGAPLILHGDSLELLELSVDGRPLRSEEYVLTDDRLTIPALPDACRLDTRVRILPEENTQLMGLYASRDGYFTQCEAEGFRRITFFLDRPDVMTRFTTTIHADRKRFPLLLSNGNLDASGDEAGGRHWARWIDPFPKPSYLFAMVAARLDRLDSEFTTMSGRGVKLTVFVQPGKLDQCDFAMESLKSAMRWDEKVFGLELDLDQYMVVAVDDFNMGAMENKGLNIFNTRYVLARADTATDHDFQMLDRVVAHEYFHNWTGNRVTCRDWFQLSLKEGLTVFRDQQYGGDRYSHALQRIEEVRLLRTVQFPEDAGPMAHPVRPESYIEISNFYTATVYNKGAELVRMIHTLLGAEAFRAGMDLYFQRHDGQAVRTEEFVAAMQDASGVDLGHFSRWYSQAGTPVVEAETQYDASRQRFILTLRQHCAPTHGQPDKQALHIPVAVGLVTARGEDMPLSMDDGKLTTDTTRVLSLTQAEQRFVFTNVTQAPVPSLLRGFSAPVVLRYEYSDAQLALLMAHDSDAFNRWEAGQRLAMRLLLQGIDDYRAGRRVDFTPAFIDACARLLDDRDADPAFVAEVLSLPNAGYIAEQMSEVDPDAILTVRVALRRRLATALEDHWRALWAQLAPTSAYSPSPAAAGRRALRNAALGYLAELDTSEVRGMCMAHLTGADNMTDAMCALALLANSEGAERRKALAWFLEKWQHESLVVDKWFSVQAASRLPDTLAQVRDLMIHPAFSMKNPNRVRALIGTFCQVNHAGFNAADGSGYAFAAEQVIALDPLNPQIAARMARSFDRWRKFDAGHQAHARTALTRIAAKKGLSRDCFEVVSRALDDTDQLSSPGPVS